MDYASSSPLSCSHGNWIFLDAKRLTRPSSRRVAINTKNQSHHQRNNNLNYKLRSDENTAAGLRLTSHIPRSLSGPYCIVPDSYTHCYNPVYVYRARTTAPRNSPERKYLQPPPISADNSDSKKYAPAAVSYPCCPGGLGLIRTWGPRAQRHGRAEPDDLRPGPAVDMGTTHSLPQLCMGVGVGG